MAFHQPTAPPVRAAAPPHASTPSRPAALTVSPPPAQLHLSDSQEWVLFSPSQAQHSPTASQAAAAAASRLSDFGSLNTVCRTDAEGLSDVLEDGSELDSLDDGLHAFRDPAPFAPSPRRWADQSGGAILPAHDGLGSFLPSSAPAQDALWGLERHNPRRRSTGGHYRSASSVHRRLRALDHEVPAEDEWGADDLRFERIQRWRLEQSRILAEEFGREKHRAQRRQSPPEEAAQPGIDEAEGEDEDGGIWQRITRTVIRNLVGIDDRVLAVILGEELAADPPGADQAAAGDGSEWEARLIRRIARELGSLVSSLAAPPPRLAAPAPLDPAGLDYAGIPAAPAAADDPRGETASDAASAAFRPTLPSRAPPQDPRTPTVAEIEYWEQTPDLKTVFSYLARRFLSSRRAGHPHFGGAPGLRAPPPPQPIATTHTQASLHRAHLISQQHPLLASQRPRRRRAASRYGGGGLAGLGLGAATGLAGAGGLASLKRAGTSCASASTKRSRLDGSEAASRNYWGGGSARGSDGGFAWMGVGGWGEV